MAGSLRRAQESDSLDDEFDATPLSDINVTPFVDVMLVLLIVFMVAAPLMTAGVAVQLPRSGAQRASESREALVVSVDKDGQAWLAKENLTAEVLRAKLAMLAREDAQRPVLVRGDRGVPYGRVMEVMGDIGAAGFARVSLISQAAAIPAPAPKPAPTP